MEIRPADQRPCSKNLPRRWKPSGSRRGRRQSRSQNAVTMLCSRPTCPWHYPSLLATGSARWWVLSRGAKTSPRPAGDPITRRRRRIHCAALTRRSLSQRDQLHPAAKDMGDGNDISALCHGGTCPADQERRQVAEFQAAQGFAGSVVPMPNRWRRLDPVSAGSTDGDDGVFDLALELLAPALGALGWPAFLPNRYQGLDLFLNAPDMAVASADLDKFFGAFPRLD